jgi:hypothetical protein
VTIITASAAVNHVHLFIFVSFHSLLISNQCFIIVLIRQHFLMCGCSAEVAYE